MVFLLNLILLVSTTGVGSGDTTGSSVVTAEPVVTIADPVAAVAALAPVPSISVSPNNMAALSATQTTALLLLNIDISPFIFPFLLQTT